MQEFIREGLHIVNEMPVEDMLYIDTAVRDGEEDNYLILIGEGGNGKVYRHEKYAIKIFNEEIRTNSTPSDGYYLSLLDRSPYFPSVFYYIDNHYMVCEFIEGDSIYEVDTDTFVSCISQLREAMNHAFSRGLITADLIDVNIIVNKKKVPVIVDVGCFQSIYCNDEITNLTQEYFRRYKEKLTTDILKNKEVNFYG